MKLSFISLSIALIGVLTISYAQNWTGGGGKGMSIAILAPKATSLGERQNHLPALVQNEFVSNFSGYSAISVLDWQRLDEIYSHLLSDEYSDEAREEVDLGNLAHTTHIMSGEITKTATGYHLQMNVTKTSDKMTAASYSGTFTFWELDNLTGVRRASLDLLQKMGITLTAKAKKELAGAVAENHAKAQAALARGVTAQRQGTEVAALSYYFQAASYDPSLMQAVSRSSILNANISSGNIGDNVRNDIAWRKQWVERLRETEQFFDNFNKEESMPYTLFYLNDIKQGKTNYKNETVEISTETYLYGSGIWTLSIERTLQAVYDGLNATGRKDVWELGSWPRHGVTNLNAFAERRKNFSVVFELVNNRNKVIDRQTLQARGSWGLSWGSRPEINISSADRQTLNFQNVNANDITDNLTIRVASVNGTDAENAAIDGVLQIKSITKSKVETNDRFRFAKGEIQGFADYTKLKEIKLIEIRKKGNTQKETIVLDKISANNDLIPSNIWGDPVISIGKEAFMNTGLGSVTIPNGVVYIGEKAFMNAGLGSVTIPNSVAYIGESAFQNNYLAYIAIPNSVKFIGKKAFLSKERIMKRITIEAENVAMASNSFGYEYTYTDSNGSSNTRIEKGFYEFYNKNGKEVGVYSSSDDDIWVYGESHEKATEAVKKEEKRAMVKGLIGLTVSAGLLLLLGSIK